MSRKRYAPAEYWSRLDVRILAGTGAVPIVESATVRKKCNEQAHTIANPQY